MTDDFHTYGVLVEEDFITFYFDGVELRKDRTPKEAKVPLYLMVDLALGGGLAHRPDAGPVAPARGLREGLREEVIARWRHTIPVGWAMPTSSIQSRRWA